MGNAILNSILNTNFKITLFLWCS